MTRQTTSANTAPHTKSRPRLSRVILRPAQCGPSDPWARQAGGRPQHKLSCQPGTAARVRWQRDPQAMRATTAWIALHPPNTKELAYPWNQRKRQPQQPAATQRNDLRTPCSVVTCTRTCGARSVSELVWTRIANKEDTGSQEDRMPRNKFTRGYV
jgi:hypothetical protein